MTLEEELEALQLEHYELKQKYNSLLKKYRDYWSNCQKLKELYEKVGDAYSFAKKVLKEKK